MRELKLKYFLELVSNLGPKSEQDARAVEAAQRRVRAEVASTTDKATALERAMSRLGANSGTERQIGYMRRLGAAIDQNVARMRNLARATAEAAPTIRAVAGGAVGGFYAGKTLLDKPMDYSMRLAHMSNTAFSERDVAGRLRGKTELDTAITKALQYGGGTRDAAAGTLDSMIAAGLGPEKSMGMLPALMKASSASGAAPEALAQIAVKAMQTFKISEDQVPELINIAMKSGQAGGFELKDMAKWLPQMMAAGKLSGLQGMEGFRRIVAGAQASNITAGTKDEAGNNVVNLLAKINSQDTSKDFQKLGLDLTGSLMKARKEGVNSLDAFIGFVDDISAKNPEYVRLRNKLNSATTKDEKNETTEALASLLEGQAVGKVIQDRQALMYLLAEMNNRSYVRDVTEKTRTANDSVGDAHDLVSQESSYKADALANSRDAAMSRAFGAGGPLNALMDGANYAAREFPVLTAAVVGTTAALGVFATALLGFGLLGGKGPLGKPGGFPKPAGAPVNPRAPGGPFGSLGNGAGTTAASAGRSWLATAGAGLSSAAKLLGPLMLLESLAGPSEEDIARLRAYEARKNGYRDKGYDDPRLLTITAPGATDQPVELGKTTEVKVGDGTLTIDLNVTHDGVTATQTVVRQPSLIRINPGATNPGSTR